MGLAEDLKAFAKACGDRPDDPPPVRPVVVMGRAWYDLYQGLVARGLDPYAGSVDVQLYEPEADVPKTAYTVADLLDWRLDVIHDAKMLEHAGVSSDVLSRSVASVINRIDSELKKHLAPVNGTPRVVKHKGGCYTWAEHDNASWNGLRTVEIGTGDIIKLDDPFTL